jgi:hypothetical protein
MGDVASAEPPTLGITLHDVNNIRALRSPRQKLVTFRAKAFVSPNALAAFNVRPRYEYR